MKQKIKDKVQQIAQSSKTKEAIVSLKPDRTIWGFFGVVLFFIVPEIVAFIWGSDITAYARNALSLTPSLVEEQYFKLLLMLFAEGGSWINLSIGVGLLVWLFYG